MMIFYLLSNNLNIKGKLVLKVHVLNTNFSISGCHND